MSLRVEARHLQCRDVTVVAHGTGFMTKVVARVDPYQNMTWVTFTDGQRQRFTPGDPVYISRPSAFGDIPPIVVVEDRHMPEDVTAVGSCRSMGVLPVPEPMQAGADGVLRVPCTVEEIKPLAGDAATPGCPTRPILSREPHLRAKG